MTNGDFIFGGCVLLARAILESEVMTWPAWQFRLWVIMLLRACHKASPAHRLARGQLRATQLQLRDWATCYAGKRPVRPSFPQLTKFIHRLRENNMVETARATRGMVITILGYDRYQRIANYESNHESATKVERKQPKGRTKYMNDINDKKKPFSQSSDELRLSRLLLDLILSRKPDLKQPDLQRWASHVDRMLRLDGRSPEAVEAVIRWCQRDDFWQNNILSTVKLRRQFDQLDLKRRADNSGAGARAGRSDYDEMEHV